MPQTSRYPRRLRHLLLLLVLSSATAVQLPQAPSYSTRGATRGAFLRSALAAVSVCGGARQAIAQDVADIPASGLVFKDTIKIEGFTDPKVGAGTIAAHLHDIAPAGSAGSPC